MGTGGQETQTRDAGRILIFIWFSSDQTETKRLNAKRLLYFYAKQIGFGHCAQPESADCLSCTARVPRIIKFNKTKKESIFCFVSNVFFHFVAPFHIFYSVLKFMVFRVCYLKMHRRSWHFMIHAFDQSSVFRV